MKVPYLKSALKLNPILQQICEQKCKKWNQIERTKRHVKWVSRTVGRIYRLIQCCCTKLQVNVERRKIQLSTKFPRGWISTHNIRLSLTNDNYDEALKLLKNRFGTNQMIISAHMNPLLKISTVKKNEDVKTLQKFYDDAESHFRISSTLRIQMESYGTIMSEKLSLEVKLVTASNIKADTWDLAKVLVLINLELRAREYVLYWTRLRMVRVVLILTHNFHVQAHLYTYVHINPILSCVIYLSQGVTQMYFSRSNHCSYKCSVISDFEARNEFLKKEKRSFFCLKPTI